MILKEKLLTKKLELSDKTIYFDLKYADNGRKYLHIKESGSFDEDVKGIIIFEDELLILKETFEDMVCYFKKQPSIIED